MSSEAIRREIEQSMAVKQRILNDARLVQSIHSVAKVCLESFRRKNRILLAGNGGSAADAQHLAAEFVGRYAFDRPGLPAIALNTDTSMLTAIGNDYGYERVFCRQLEANGAKGDVFVAISTSGNSENLVLALKRAREVGIVTVGFTGEGGGAMREHCEHCLCVPSKETPRIQESHIMIGHIICGLVESELFGESRIR